MQIVHKKNFILKFTAHSILCTLCLIFFGQWSFAGEQSTPSRPAKVVVGAYINQLLEINFSEDFFVVDFWLWFRWSLPTEPGEYDLSNYDALNDFEIVNGIRQDMRGDFTGVKEHNGKPFKFQTARVIAKITKRFNMKPYPSDSHFLTIQIEDSEHSVDTIEFVADVDNSSWSPDITIPGWSVEVVAPKVGVNLYKSNFGNLELGEKNVEEFYSQFQYSVHLTKPVVVSVIKSLWPTFLATFIAIISLSLRANVSARFDLQIGAIFAIVANKFTITSSIQDTVQFGFSDIVQLISSLLVVGTITQSVISYRMDESGVDYERTIRPMDFRWGVGFSLCYLLAVASLIPIFRFFG